MADAHLKRHGPPSTAVVVTVTNGQLDFGTGERIFQGQAERLARKSWRLAAEAGVGQGHSSHGGAMTEGQNSLPPTIYEIRIKGHLNHIWDEWFYDLTIIHEEDGTTTLYGPLSDQTVLHSVLDRIRDMNLRLISVTEVKVTPSDR